jgi:proteasome-associated ATPase
VGSTQENIRECFRTLREAAREDPAILFLDEIEAVGRIRGGGVSHHSDKFLAALLAELDGFEERRNVAIITATNRKELVDPALLERLSDIEIEVNRPNQAGARAIFEIHLPPTVPFSPNQDKAGETRREVIETAVSLFYSPNAENELCTIRFRDGTTRTVAARELASGRVFEQVCRAARRRAFLRDINGGESGLRLDDMEHAIDEALEHMRTTLKPRNAHVYLSDLPQDVDVVAIEPISRKVKSPRRYLSLVNQE